MSRGGKTKRTEALGNIALAPPARVRGTCGAVSNRDVSVSYHDENPWLSTVTHGDREGPHTDLIEEVL